MIGVDGAQIMQFGIGLARGQFLVGDTNMSQLLQYSRRLGLLVVYDV